MQDEDQQNQELLDLSKQILDLTKDVHIAALVAMMRHQYSAWTRLLAAGRRVASLSAGTSP